MNRSSPRFTSRPTAAVSLLLASVAAAAWSAPEAVTTNYTEARGAAVNDLVYEMVQDGPTVSLTSTGASGRDAITWRSGSGTEDWRTTDGKEGTDLHAVRSDNVIHVTGTLKNRPVDRDVKVDGAPWYQLFGPLLDLLLPEGSQQKEFWVLDPADLAAHKMQVRRAGMERITVGGQAVDAEKIHFSPAGALAPFWGADFWYRRSDHLYISSRLPEHGGVTVTTIEGLAP